MSSDSACIQFGCSGTSALRGRFRAFSIAVLVVCLVAGIANGALAQTVRTDKQDYLPGETVVITGNTIMQMAPA